MATRGKASPTRLDRKKILLAARRFYNLGHTQAEIARDLGISAGYLARRLKKAKDDGWIRIFVDADREVELAAQIMAKYPHLRHVEVVPSGSTPEATARSVATAMAVWFDDLLDRDEELAAPKVQRVAIGAAWPQRLMVEQLKRRQNRCSVGPTSLAGSQSPQLEQQTASVVATILAHRMGVFGAHPHSPKLRQYLYDLRLETPTNREELARWWKELERRADYRQMREFWRSCDVAFISAVGINRAWPSTTRQLATLGVSVERLNDIGAVAWCAGVPLDAAGQVVPLLCDTPGLYAHGLPDFAITQEERAVVLDLWGDRAVDAVDLVNASFVSHLFCDVLVASAIISP